MNKMQTLQYTVRGVPPRVDEALRRRARQERKSVNQAAVEAIARGLGLAPAQKHYNDMDDLVSTWVDDPAFDRAIREMDQVDPDLWK